MNTTWTQRTDADTDTWERRIDGGLCYVTQYKGSTSYNWQFWRGRHGLSGVVDAHDAAISKTEAMAQAEAMEKLPVDEFNARVVADLVSDMHKIERDIASLSPTAAILPGYHAGYEAGVADTKRMIAAAIDIDCGPNA